MAQIVTSSDIPKYSVDLRIRHGLKANLTPQDLNAPRMLFFDDTKEVAVSQGDGTYLNISESIVLVRQYIDILSNGSYVPDRVLELLEEQERVLEQIEFLLGISEGSESSWESSTIKEIKDRLDAVERRIRDIETLDICCNLTDDEFVGRIWS